MKSNLNHHSTTRKSQFNHQKITIKSPENHYKSPEKPFFSRVWPHLPSLSSGCGSATWDDWSRSSDAGRGHPAVGQGRETLQEQLEEFVKKRAVFLWVIYLVICLGDFLVMMIFWWFSHKDFQRTRSNKSGEMRKCWTISWIFWWFSDLIYLMNHAITGIHWYFGP